eukprot:1184100-Amorphochlora_amoeboformis.AAC.1
MREEGKPAMQVEENGGSGEKKGTMEVEGKEGTGVSTKVPKDSRASEGESKLMVEVKASELGEIGEVKSSESQPETAEEEKGPRISTTHV